MGVPSSPQARPMTVADANRIAGWRYGDDWSVYDLDSAQPLIDDLDGYRSVVAGGTLIGFYCVGDAARARGLAEDSATLDIGMGMDPALVGRGRGAEFGHAVLAQVARNHPGVTLRAVVQSWNQRSLRLAHSLGFEETGEFTAVQGGRPVVYSILVKPALPEHDSAH